jgi:hypothetical protein
MTSPALSLSATDSVFVLTGAGVSAESGIATFRDADGLWERHRIEDVATPEAFDADPALVWRFYGQRRAQAATVRPNPGHVALAELEARLGERLYLATQNVDDLHEAAGSRAGGPHARRVVPDPVQRSRLRDRAVSRSAQRLLGRPAALRLRRAPAPAHRVVRRDAVRDARDQSARSSGPTCSCASAARGWSTRRPAWSAR